MKKHKRWNPTGRKIVLCVMVVLFLAGVFLAVRTAIWAREAIYREHDKHLSALACTVDHNIGIVLDRCRRELSGLVENDSFQEAERAMILSGDSGKLKHSLKKSAVLLTDYADRILVSDRERVILTTEEDGNLDFSIQQDTDGDDVWLCVDNKTEKSYIGLSCYSETGKYTYFVLIDMDPFFRSVVVDTIIEDHWVVLYDAESGLTLQNDATQPEFKIFSEEEILGRDDGYTRICEQNGSEEEGASTYKYIPEDEEGQKSEPGVEEQDTRIYIIPASRSENGVFSVAVAAYNEQFTIPMERMTFNSILAAVIIAFSVAVVAFMLLHSGRRERELANELAALEKEKELSDELLQQQEQLIHHQKLETIGTLTAGIAHEFNNLLSPIMGNSMLILEKSRTEDEEIFGNALEIYNASDQAKELVLKISKLSRRQSVMQMHPIDPEELITDVLAMSKSFIPGNISVTQTVFTDRQILGDEGQLGHMLLNLVINSVQAMSPEGGRLTISAESDSHSVYISVSDTGKGIPETDLNSVFDPFFTTKEAGKGTGLGLAIAQRIAVNHGGNITVENLPTSGAKFTFKAHIYTQ